MRKILISMVSLCFTFLFLFSAQGQSNPTVTINQAAAQSDPTSNSPIHFTVIFSESVTGFTGSDISFIGSTGFIFLLPVVNVTGGPIIYDVAVSGMTSNVTVVASVPAGVVLNAAFQSNLASTSTDNSVVYNIPPCTITCPSNITVAATSVSGAVVNYNVTPTGDCQNIVRLPVSGTVFPVGTTTVNAYNNVSTGMAYGLTGSNQLVTFNVNTSNPTFISSTIPVTGLQAAIPGVQQAEKLAAIDFRPSNSQLYGIGIIPLGILDLVAIKLYTINKTTGAATAVGAGFQLAGIDFSIDFNPVSDELRVLSNLGSNVRVNADLGTVIATDPGVNYPSSGPFDQNTTGFVGNAHSNNLANSNFTTLYLIHEKSSSLYIQGGINGIPSPNTGSATLVGPLGVYISSGFDLNASAIAGFDISLSAGALAIFNVSGVSQLYSISLNTGTATLIGNFSGVNLIDIAIPPVTLPASSCSFTVTVNPPVPSVTINQAVGQTDPTNISPVNFTAVFSEPVTGFTSADVLLSGTAGATTAVVTEVSPNNGTKYNIAVSGMTITGTVIASMPSGAVHNSNNIANSASTSTDNTVTYSQPLSVTINQAASQSDPTSDSPIHFTVTFSEAVTGFTGSDISFIGSTGFIFLLPVVNVTGGPIIYDVAVSGMTSNVTVAASVPAGVVLNAAFQSNLASTSTDNSVVYNIPPCTITCPSNITVAATSLSGAVVNYSVTPAGDCRNIVRIPATSTTFPIGTTTVNAYNNVSSGLTYLLARDIYGDDILLKFNVNTVNPTALSSQLTISGLANHLGAVDFRPSNGQLYGLETTPTGLGSDLFKGKIYSINTTTGVATGIGSGTFDLIGDEFSIDFNPVTDELRVLSTTGYNLRIDPDLGTIIAVDPVVSGNSFVVGGAHTNSFVSATSTTLYSITGGDGSLFIQGGINGAPSPNTGSTILVGPLGIGYYSTYAGFDISPTGGALALLKVNDTYQLHSIALNTGDATLIGNFEDGFSYVDIAIAPVLFPAPSCSFTVTVTQPPVAGPDLSIVKTANNATANIGQQVGYTITVTNIGAGSASGVTVSDPLPSGLNWSVNSQTGIAFSITGALNSQVLVGNIGTLAAGANTSVTVTATAINSGTISNTATVSSSNEASDVLSNNTSSASITVAGPDLSIVKTANNATANTGQQVGYTLTVTNIGAGSASGVTVSDPLPSGLNWSINSQTGIAFSITGALNSQVLVGNIGTLAAGANTSVIITATATIPGTITNTATVSSSNEAAGVLTNNTSTATITINNSVPPTITCPANIVVNSSQGGCDATVSFTGENAIVITGSPHTISYTIFFENGGQSGSGIPGAFHFPIGVNTVNITAANDAGSSSCSFTVTVVDNQPPVINCPSNIIANAQAGQCSADVSITISGSDNCLSDRGLTVASAVLNTFIQYPGISSFSASQIRNFPVGTTTINVLATDASGNTATCSFNVTVLDIEKPVIISKPSDVTVECTSQIPVVNIASVSATDNCGTPTITHVDDVISNQTCANKYTVTRTYKATDGSGNTTTVIQLITVDDKTPPTITGLTPSKRILAPPNHKMVDVTLAYTVNDNCVSTPNVIVSITSNEPINGTGDGDTDPDWEVIDGRHIRLRAERSGQGTGRIYTITVTVSDGCNASVSATTEVMVVHNITGPHSGNSFKVGSTVAFTGEFWDVPGNKHTAKWSIDGTSVSGVVTEPAGSKNGKVTGSYKFTAPGVYKLQMNVTDQKGVTTYANTNGDLEAIVVIYDPNGGYTYGGGYYDSRAGALVSNPSSTGKASYGFAMNYFKNSTNPKGETQFEFKVGEFEFNALNFDYLVISNSMAQFKGTGKIIGGQSGVAFTMTVTDGQLDGSGIDKIRMKIYNKNNGKIIYDNQPGASDAALPTQAVGTNSIVVISGINSSLTSANTSQKTGMEATETKAINGLDVIAYPNPSINNFSITVQASAKEKIMMQVVDMYGRIIETRNVSANSIVRFGDRYRSGTYFVRVIQGKEHKEIKLVKLSD